MTHFVISDVDFGLLMELQMTRFVILKFSVEFGVFDGSGDDPFVILVTFSENTDQVF